VSRALTSVIDSGVYSELRMAFVREVLKPDGSGNIVLENSVNQALRFSARVFCEVESLISATLASVSFSSLFILPMEQAKALATV
jgi:hypothetical protein